MHLRVLHINTMNLIKARKRSPHNQHNPASTQACLNLWIVTVTRKARMVAHTAKV